jgi:hypothetical protein
MKNLKTVIASALLMALIVSSSCTRRYTCPTYTKNVEAKSVAKY